MGGVLLCPVRAFNSFLTREAAKAERPESVIQHRQGVTGVVQLAASDDPKVVQGHQTH